MEDHNAKRTFEQEYQHEPLPDASSCIRLLTTRPYDGDGPYTLDCELTTWRIDEAPEFYAISYSWGDPAKTARLRVDGRHMGVTQNCAIALCQANLHANSLRNVWSSKSRNGCGYYWCDAVCIDQQNTAEKTAQVASMGRIYRRAEQVVACLGPHGERVDSKFLFRKLRSRSGLLRRIGEHWTSETRFHLDLAWVTDKKWSRMVMLFLMSMPRCSIIRLCRALENLLATAYFERTWICQELFLGRNVIICCGTDRAPISEIYGLAQASTLLRSVWRIKPVERLWRLFHPWLSEQQLRQYDCNWTRYFLWLLSAASLADPQANDLGSLMWHIRYQECGDIRDKVYGTLSMVSWPDDQEIKVDYAIDSFDLATQVMKVIRKRPVGWDGRWYDVADSVASNLMLGVQPSEKLAENIRERCSALTSISSTRVNGEPHQELPSTATSGQYDVFWGYRLVKTNNQWTFEGQSSSVPGLAEGRHTRIRTWQADLKPQIDHEGPGEASLDDLLLPPVARPGDWCLMHTGGRPVDRVDSFTLAFSRLLTIERIVLIARESGDNSEHPLSIIGKGLIYSDMAFLSIEHPIGTEFQVHMQDEDALVLAASSKTVDGSGSGAQGELARTGTWACKNEVSCYFNTPVCRGVNPAYAIRMEKKDANQDILEE